MSVTVRDIAKLCQVSPGTVSRVLNNRQNVKEETRQRVLEAVRELKYDPLDTAPAVQKISVTTYGLVMPIRSMHSVSTYYSRAINAFSASLEKSEIRCVLLNQGQLEKVLLQEERNPHTALGVDKLILMGIEQPLCDMALRKLKEWHIPTVLVRRVTDEAGVPAISDDDAKGVRSVLDHLFSLGHSRIAFVNERASYLKKRIDVFNEYHAVKGLVTGTGQAFSLAERLEPVEIWAEERMSVHGATAFLCGSDDLAVQVLKHCRNTGRRVPEDVSVVSIDGGYITEMYSPAITSLYIPVERMVELAVTLLNGSDGWNEKGNYSMEVPNELIVRESTAKPGSK